MNWDPSVRTRHILILFALLLAAVGAMLCFNLTRLLHAQLAAKHKAIETLADQVTQLAQQAILAHPQEPPQVAVGQDPALATLVKASVGASSSERKDFVYCAILAADGTIIAQSDPQDLRRQTELLASFAEFEQTNWAKQLFFVLRRDGFYELTTPINLSNKPFVNILAGVPAVGLRNELLPHLKLGLVLALIVLGCSLLLAGLASGYVLRPLREILASIEHLEAESLSHAALAASAQAASVGPAATGNPAGPAGAANPNNDMQNIAQRLRELGRRFAGSRNEIETIRDQLQQVVGNLTERVLLLDREQRVIMASPEAEKLLGNGDLTLRGKRLADTLTRAHPLSAITERAYLGRQSLQEVATFAVNGSRQPQTILASVQLFQDRGQPAGALLTLRDFETIQRLETQLDFASKVAALNRITAGVAHEVKNPLHSMVIHLELLSAKLEAGLDPKQHLDILTSEVNRLKRVVQTFLDFTRPVDVKLKECDANTLVREVILLAADARAQGVDLNEQYGPGPLQIKADTDLLKQALLNIIVNGCQAMAEKGEGGRLTLSTGRHREDEQEYVFIDIRDTGPGIPPEVRDKIFNLYYTTKSQGSGIGLAQAFRAVQFHNGRIQLDTEVGKGTCFRILLPRV
jgi:signal transduction histidine kinase